MGIGYKLFKVKRNQPGKLFPLYVYANEETRMNEWIPAKEGILTKNKKVKSKLGELCYRPGWHCSDIPLATHIGVKVDGVIKYMHSDEVWCEVEYSDEIDYTNVVKENGTINGKLISKKAYMTEIPVDGFYRYKTNPNMTGDWIIAGAIKVNRILSDEEVEEICKRNGYEALPRMKNVS